MRRAERPRRRRLVEAGRDLWLRLRTEGATPGRQAGAIALGLFIGCLPLYGAHLVLCFAIAGRLGLNRLNTYLAAHVNNPLTAPFLLTASFVAGHRLLRGGWPSGAPELDTLSLWTVGRETLVGSVVVGSLLAALGALLAWRLARRPTHDPFDRRAEAAAARYLPSGIGHWELARGKLRGDPLYREVAARLDGVGAEGAVLDLGCGRGLVLSLLAERHRGGLLGVERRESLAAVARRALGDDASIVTADLTEWTPTEARAVLLLDVLHYLGRDEQSELLAGAVEALDAHGVLLVREADAAGGARFLATRLAERAAAMARGAWRQRFAYRRAAEWAELLTGLGVAPEVVPLSRGTPFANVLLVARRPPAAGPAG
jgi:uncharacterized protein (DUF2062 family)